MLIWKPNQAYKPRASSNTPGNDTGIRVLNPLPIIEQARQHMGQLRRGTAAENIGFYRKADNIDAFMTLKKALLTWKQSTSRRFERAPCSNEAKQHSA